MNDYQDEYLNSNLKKSFAEAKNPDKRKEWRKLATEGMVSCVGEYTPVEFVALLDYVDFLEEELNRALCGEWDG